MQLLFDRSDEGPGEGIGLIPGVVRRLDARRVPHIGWNSIDEARDPLFQCSPLGMAYFANSYVCRPSADDVVTAWTTHESDRFPAAVRRARTVGVQFHPEKSSGAGVRLIHAFLEEVKR
jgi:glutamine amidotransferase